MNTKEGETAIVHFASFTTFYLEHWSNNIMFTQHHAVVNQVGLKSILIIG